MEVGKVCGEWTCIKILGRGSFGIVFLVKNGVTRDLRAVKRFEVRSPPANDGKSWIVDEMKERWKKEVDMMYNLNCPWIVSTFDPPKELGLGLGGGGVPSPSSDLPLLFMEFCSRGDVRMMLKRPENIAGFPENEVKRILGHISGAISYLHERSIIHRDLKPENILIQGDSNGSNIYKLGDLGFAKDVSNTALCSTVVGTLQYLAPEIYNGKMYDKTVDYWSFGLIAFEIMTGMRPFLHGEPPSVWIPLVEDKPKEIISIFRDDAGKIQYAKDIPYFVHCSGLLKMCLETWLRTMLQLDPSLRGKRVQPESDSDPESCPMKVLSNILTTRFLSIKNPHKKLSFAIGKSTTLGGIQDLITRDLGVPKGDQMILTEGGEQVGEEELAIEYYEKRALYLVSNDEKLMKNPRLKMPKITEEFIKGEGEFKDPLKCKSVWSCAIYFAQSELERVETIQSTLKAYMEWRKNKYVSKMNSLKSDLDKALASLDRILEFEEQLEVVQKRFDVNSPDYAHIWRNERVKLLAKVDSWDLSKLDQDFGSKFKNLDLFAIFGNILRAYEDWVNPESAARDRRGMDELKQNLIQFVGLRNEGIEKLFVELGRLFEEVQKDVGRIGGMEELLKSYQDLTSQIMKNRCERMCEFLTSGTSGQKSSIAGGSGLGSLADDAVNIMTESQVLQMETESALKDAMNNAKTILDEKEKMDWKFSK